MTAFDRFDPFEQRISAAIDEIAIARRPDYLDEVFRQTARTSQRPRWTFPGRWLPAGIVPRLGPTVGLPPGSIVLVVLALLLAAAIGIAVVGALTAVPSPFGLADNGLIGNSANGDLFVRDTLSSEPRLLIGTAAPEQGPWFSPDGTRLLFIRTTGGKDFLWVARADGSGQRRLVNDPLFGDYNATWAPDSRSVLVLNEVVGLPGMTLVDTDGGPSRMIDLGDVSPTSEMAFRPPDGRELLIRGQRPDSTIDLFLVDLATGDVRPLGLPSELLLGPQWDNTGLDWRPGGERIAYNRVDRDPVSGVVRFRIHTILADGTDDIALPGPTDPTIQEAWPLYSPDGKWILVHSWTWKSNGGGAGWIALMPADGSRPAEQIGPTIAGGEDTGISKTWSPDGTRILMRARNTRKSYSIDPVTGVAEELPWTDELPDWQRVVRWP